MVHISAFNNIVQKIYLKFSDPEVGLQTKASSLLSRQHCCVGIEKCETEIPRKKGATSPLTKRTQFPLVLAWASTVHKVQGLSLDKGVLDFNLRKQRSFGPGQMCTALSRIKAVDKSYCVGEFKRSAIKFNTDALNEYKCLQGNSLFSTVDKNFISDKTLTIFTMNMRSIVKHVQDLINDCRILKNDVVGFTETQIKLSDSNCLINEVFKNYNIYELQQY